MRSALLACCVAVTMLLVQPPPAQAEHLALPVTDPPCGPQDVEVLGWSGRGDVRQFAHRQLAQFFAGSGDLLLVLGATPTAIWVLEAQARSSACGNDECPQVHLRELGFTGSRRYVELSRAITVGDRELTTLDRVSKRLEAWRIISGRGLRPVRFVTNPRPAESTDQRSDWALKINDSQHRRTYLWRKQFATTMCWCTSDWYINTYPWSR